MYHCKYRMVPEKPQDPAIFAFTISTLRRIIRRLVTAMVISLGHSFVQVDDAVKWLSWYAYLWAITSENLPVSGPYVSNIARQNFPGFNVSRFTFVIPAANSFRCLGQE